MKLISFFSKVLSRSAKEKLKKCFLFKCYEKYLKKQRPPITLEDIKIQTYEQRKAQDLIKQASTMVDLGCGQQPHEKATVAVDKYIEPIHRKFGGGRNIDIAKIEAQGVKFVKADLEDLPFKDKEFDLAYTHHVVEHLDNPERALKEMMRIARKGVIICPGMLAEHIFGRKYHKWVVTSRDNLLIFIEKNWRMPFFGEGPFLINGKIRKSKNYNPFDILLNDGNWYHGIHRYKYLSNLIREYWYGGYSCMETCFCWENVINYIIIYNDGKIVHSFNS